MSYFVFYNYLYICIKAVADRLPLLGKKGSNFFCYRSLVIMWFL